MERQPPPPLRDPAVLSLGTLALGIKAHLDNHVHVLKCGVGPISAVRLALHKNGWSFESPLVLRDKHHNSYHLPTVAPKRVANIFAKDMRETIARRSILRHLMKDDATNIEEGRLLLDNGVNLQPIYSLFNTLDTKRAYTVLRIATNGIFTNVNFLHMGYDIDPVCTQCFSAVDSVFHRCYTCPFISQRAELALGSTLFNTILEAGEGSLMASRCLHPDVTVLSQPSDQAICEYINFEDGDTFCVTNGYVFGDGSAFHGAHPQVARAGFSVVQINGEGEILRAIYGSVPRYLPQTSLAAEYAAFYIFAVNTDAATTYVGDCEDVISNFNGGLARALRPSAIHADTWRACIAKKGMSFCESLSVRKVKAHQNIDNIVDANLKVLAMGNAHADTLAKKGAELHPPNSDDVLRLKKTHSDIRNQMLHMVDCLMDVSLSRTELQGKLKRLPKGSKLPLDVTCSLNGSRKHSLKWQGRFWVCEVCFIRSKSVSGFSKVCQGPPLFGSLLATPGRLGHCLWSAGVSGGGALLYCNRCFHYASPHPRLLMQPCIGTISGKFSSEKYYLLRRRHPVCKSRLLLPCRVPG